jgi:hypothetical protein
MFAVPRCCLRGWLEACGARVKAAFGAVNEDRSRFNGQVGAQG